MSYIDALKAAGAKVEDFREFGSYQGTWFALVTFRRKVGFVSGSYGSCSGCDAFQGEFGFQDTSDAGYQWRLKKFGLSYLEAMLSYDGAVRCASANIEWDTEADAMLAWVRSHAQRFPEKDRLTDIESERALAITRAVSVVHKSRNCACDDCRPALFRRRLPAKRKLEID